MTAKRNLPVEGRAIRFAPERKQKPAAAFWKIWVEGNEVYALVRSLGGLVKISVHSSGQIHCRLEKKSKQDFAPLMQLGSGPWFHAFELRFLLSDGANPPRKQLESLKNKGAHLISVPDGFFLCVNLIIGSTRTSLDYPLPEEILGQPLWRARLRDNRIAVLVGRVLELDDQNLGLIKHMREELKPTLTHTSKPEYIEIYRIQWSQEGGNVILIIPMGEEVFRYEQDDALSNAQTKAPRAFHYRSGYSRVELIAPNGANFAVVELSEIDKQIELVRGVPKTVELGLLAMQLEPHSLIAGSSFTMRPQPFGFCPQIGGGRPNNWESKVHAQFDGRSLTIELHQNSFALQNKNFASPISRLEDDEEIVVTVPVNGLKVSSNNNNQTVSAKFLGKFLLRGRR